MPKDHRPRLKTAIMALACTVLRLLQSQAQLFKAELRQGAACLRRGVLLAVCAAAFAVTTLVFAGIALEAWLTILLESRVAAALSIAGGMAVIALILALCSARAFSSAFQPSRTLQSLTAIVKTVAERGKDG